MKPIGLLRPNDFALFDIQGNVAERCNDSNPGNRSEGGQPLERAMMGGAAFGSSNYENAAEVSSMRVIIQDNSQGFRVARTIPVPQNME